jgi:lipopolysaccharide transport system ATP-binding protein
MRRIHDLRAGGTTILFVSHETGDVKALCERCLWLENGSVRGLGEADDVVGDYLSAMMRRERVRDAKERTSAVQSAPEVVRTLSGTHRYGDGSAEVSGAELTTAAGLHLERWTAGVSAVLRLSFRVRAALRAPIAGFLVRNEKGETIFGSNTTRENYPLPEMEAGEVHTVDFHWVLPELAPGKYYVSVAVSEGTLDDFHVCDYVEDGIVIEAPSTGRGVHGYLRLRCSSVEIHPG